MTYDDLTIETSIFFLATFDYRRANGMGAYSRRLSPRTDGYPNERCHDIYCWVALPSSPSQKSKLTNDSNFNPMVWSLNMCLLVVCWCLRQNTKKWNMRLANHPPKKRYRNRWNRDFVAAICYNPSIHPSIHPVSPGYLVIISQPLLSTIMPVGEQFCACSSNYAETSMCFYIYIYICVCVCV